MPAKVLGPLPLKLAGVKVCFCKYEHLRARLYRGQICPYHLCRWIFIANYNDLVSLCIRLTLEGHLTLDCPETRPCANIEDLLRIFELCVTEIPIQCCSEDIMNDIETFLPRFISVRPISGCRSIEKGCRV